MFFFGGGLGFLFFVFFFEPQLQADLRFLEAWWDIFLHGPESTHKNRTGKTFTHTCIPIQPCTLLKQWAKPSTRLFFQPQLHADLLLHFYLSPFPPFSCLLLLLFGGGGGVFFFLGGGGGGGRIRSCFFLLFFFFLFFFFEPQLHADLWIHLLVLFVLSFLVCLLFSSFLSWFRFVFVSGFLGVVFVWMLSLSVFCVLFSFLLFCLGGGGGICLSFCFFKQFQECSVFSWFFVFFLSRFLLLLLFCFLVFFFNFISFFCCCLFVW